MTCNQNNDSGEKWVVYAMHHEGGTGPFLAVADSKDEAEELGDKWWIAFHEGEKAQPEGYAGISWKPVAEFDEWKHPDEDR